MLIYQEQSSTQEDKYKENQLNIIINATTPAGITLPGDLVLEKDDGTVSVSFATPASTLSITGSAATYSASTITITGQASLSGGSNATVMANIALPLAVVSSVAAATGNNNSGKITVVTNGVSNTFQIPGLGTAAYQDTDYFLAAGDSADYIKSVSVAGNTLTLTNQAGTATTFTNTTYGVATAWASGLMSAVDKIKLNGIAVGAEVNVRSDWDQTDSTKDDYIKNKPTIPTTYIQSASVNENTLTLTDQSGSTITYTASSTDKYQAPDYSTGLKISTGTDGVNSLYIPFATLANSQFCLLDEDGRSVSVAEVITHITTCFRGDTSYVTMYDGTTKLISEVKAGDSVLGYDVNKQDYCEAIVLDNIKTGEANAFDCYVFEDGTTIDIYGDDSFLTHHMSNFDNPEAENSDCFSACGIKYLYTRSTEKKEHFRKIIKSTGGKDAGVAVIYKQDFYCATPTGRYCIDTSNGTCFINGLCQARKPINMLNRLVKYHKTFGPKIDSIFAGIFARYAEGADDLIPDDHIEDVSSATLLKELTENSAVIEMKKSYLNSTDYKAMKYAEGVLSEEEWLPIKTKRAEARTEINNMEARNAEIIPILKEANPCLMKEYGDKYWWVKKNRKEMLDFADLNSMLEDVREYFNAQG